MTTYALDSLAREMMNYKDPRVYLVVLQFSAQMWSHQSYESILSTSTVLKASILNTKN